MPTIPNVFFNLTNTGTTPINPLVKNRIAIVGRFDRGIVGEPTYGLGDYDVRQRYGFADQPGDLAYRAARSQQAEDFALVRVLGQTKQACAAILLNGYASVDNTLQLGISDIGAIESQTTDPGSTLVQFAQYNSQPGVNVKGTLHLSVFNIANIPGNESITFRYLFVDQNSTQTFPIDWNNVNDLANVNIAAPNFIQAGLDLLIDFSNIATTQIGDSFSISVVDDTITVPVQANEIASQINSSLIQALLATGVYESVERTAADDGVIICLSPDIAEGSAGNSFNLNINVANPDGFIALNGNTFTTINQGSTSYGNPIAPLTFAGGADGPRNAVKDFYAIDSTPLLRIISASPGNWGNNLRVTIYPTSITEFKLTVVDTSQADGENTETFILDFTNTDNEGYLKQLENSQYIRGIFLPKANNLANAGIYEAFSPLRVDFLDPLLNTALPIDLNPTHPDHYGAIYTQDIPLSNGYDGLPIGDADYIAAIESLASFPAHIILTDGYTSTAIEQALIQHAENSTELEGLRIALLPAPKYLAPSAAQSFITGIGSRRAVGVAGWHTYSLAANSDRFSVPATAAYAGVLSSIPYFLSPAARGIITPLVGISEVDIAKNSNLLSLELYGESRLEILALDPVLLNYAFTTGSTLSSDTNWRRISTVRTFDYIRQDIYRLLNQFKSRPHTGAIRDQIATSIDSYLETLLTNGEIANYLPTIINSTNNSQADFLANRLNIKICVLDLASLDFIYVNLFRDTTLSLGFIEI